MAEVDLINEAEHEAFNARTHRFALWVFAMELTGAGALVVTALYGGSFCLLAIALCFLRSLAMVLWGHWLLKEAPEGGPMGDYDDLDEDDWQTSPEAVPGAN